MRQGTGRRELNPRPQCSNITTRFGGFFNDFFSPSVRLIPVKHCGDVEHITLALAVFDLLRWAHANQTKRWPNFNPCVIVTNYRNTNTKRYANDHTVIQTQHVGSLETIKRKRDRRPGKTAADQGTLHGEQSNLAK
jgi:hypothetical protein